MCQADLYIAKGLQTIRAQPVLHFCSPQSAWIARQAFQLLVAHTAQCYLVDRLSKSIERQAVPGGLWLCAARPGGKGGVRRGRRVLRHPRLCKRTGAPLPAVRPGGRPGEPRLHPALRLPWRASACFSRCVWAAILYLLPQKNEYHDVMPSSRLALQQY